ncbi:transmembrane protein 135-like [Uranotaenia lowii]|uniref:transmembrane protein 135-like n=1 Tax=Uranotaenia lowii TaxID=190385 RepID=UPI00247A72B9|nr:transmembrane protein 135-like [Uranotaenia lowii]
MSELSKCFYRATAGKTCRDLWHPEYASCWRYTFDVWKSIAPGSFKLFFPLLVLPPLIKDGVTRSYLVKQLVEYIQISFGTFVQTALALNIHCISSNTLGYLNYWWLMFWPISIAVAIGPELPPKLLRLQAITFFNMMTETMIKKSHIPVVQFLRTSKAFGTLLFMIFSSAIMSSLGTGVVKQFWLINPPPKVEEPSQDLKNCQHERTCQSYILDGMMKYASVGLILEFARAVLSKFPLLMKNRPAFWKHFFKLSRTRLGLFLSLHVGLYRGVCCLLKRHSSSFGQGAYQSLIAGFVSGIAYWVHPTYQLFTLAFSKAIEMTWEYWMKTGNVPSFVRQLDRLPFIKMAHVFSFGYLGHMYAFHHHLVPGFHIKAVDYCSKNLTVNMRRRLIGYILAVE